MTPPATSAPSSLNGCSRIPRSEITGRTSGRACYNLTGVESVYVLDLWLRETFRANTPYDQFVCEIVLPKGTVIAPTRPW